MASTQGDTIAELQRANAELRRELSERDAALAQRDSDRDERIAHQAATVDVLKAMSASPGNAQPVFDLICRQARSLLHVIAVALFEYDGALVHFRALDGDYATTNAEAHAAYVRAWPQVPDRGSLTCRAILDGTLVHVRDLAAEPGISQAVRDLGHKTQVSIPLLRDGRAIGALTTSSPLVDGVTDTQIELLRTFAEQAVIAITSAETYRALQTRTADLQESLEYQTATSDVLKVISRSASDLEPVLAAVAATAARLCDSDQAMISRYEDGVMWLGANFGFPPEYEAHVRAAGRMPVSADNQTVSARAHREGRVVHIEDVAAVPGYSRVAIELGKQRTSLGVPLLRDGQAIGCIVLARQRVEPFTERQIELVRTFADQAVIAIENTRLMTEQREALEQQTATAEVLGVINASPGNLTPVFDAVLEKALRLCGASIGGIYSYNGSQFEPSAFRGITPEFAAFDPGRPLTLNPGGILDTILRTRRPVQDPDLRDTDRYRSNNPYTRALVDLGKIRALLDVPLLKDGEVIGVITIFRGEPGAFTDKQIALLENFAAQAVIAMENARLLTEQKEALEQQTATAEVLQVINASPGDLAPVFQTMLDRALRLCGAAFGELSKIDGDITTTVAVAGMPAAFSQVRVGSQLRPGPGTASWRFRHGENIVHIADLADTEAYRDGEPVRRALVDDGGARALLAVSLRKDDALLGLISIFRQEPGAFTAKQIALLENFAAQAVIAMENARLLTETREALEQQTATAEVLQVINASPGDLTPVLDAMLEKALRLCGGTIGGIFTIEGNRSVTRALQGVTPAFASFQEQYPIDEIEPGTVPARIIDTRRPVQNPDVKAGEAYRNGVPYARALADLGDIRAVLAAPLVKDGVAVGMIALYREQPGAFADKQVALLENFAAQAVIAMENARLLTETREALEQQIATAEVLQVINASPGDLAPVFQSMLDRALRLCGAAFGELTTIDGDVSTTVAVSGMPAAFSQVRVGSSSRQGPGTTAWRLRHGENIVHVTDLVDTDLYRDGEPARRTLVDDGGARALLVVPLRKDDALLGLIGIFREEPGAFTVKQIALLENFAAQAVIAMENARLLTETREALEQQTATAEVLQVINASPGNLAPVFDAILERAHRICRFDHGALALFDGTHFRSVATRGYGTTGDAVTRVPYRPSGAQRLVLRGARYGHIPDVSAFSAEPDDTVFTDWIALTGFRATLLVPLRKDGVVIGHLSGWRLEAGPFSEKEISLLENFAAQAVIAMENARLLTETREALEQQTATAEVLQVINASPGNLAPVFDAMLEKAMRLCGVAFGSFHTWDGEATRFVAMRGFPPAIEAYVATRGPSRAPGPWVSIMAETRRPVPYDDFLTSDAYLAGQPDVRALADLGGVRVSLVVPLLKDQALVGYIAVYRLEVRPFSDKEIALLENFAAQAVIAMENARLLTETREALERQTATAEVLQVINESPGDLGPVFDIILEKAHALCGAAVGSLITWDGELMRAVATHGQPEDYAAELARGFRPTPKGPARRLVEGERFVQVPDIRTLAPDPGSMVASAIDRTGMRTVLQVPLRKEGALLGYISAAHTEIRPFAEKEIALLENFAAQAVIAMENARLLTEQREALERQTATAELLEVINTSPGNLTPVFESILEKAHLLCGASSGSLMLYEGNEGYAVATLGLPDHHDRLSRQRWQLVGGHLLLQQGGRLVHMPDMKALEYDRSHVVMRNMIENTSCRTGLLLPLRKDNVVLGCISAYRSEVRLFSDKEIALLENFAAQAVIAMENARLLTEQREALERQTAMAEVLQVINANPGNLAPVFDVILAKAHSVCGADMGTLFLWDGTFTRGVAALNYSDDVKEMLSRPRPPASITNRLIAGERYLHIHDVLPRAAEMDEVIGQGYTERSGVRSNLTVPLRRDGAYLGHITANRKEVRPYSDSEISLLESFAAQAVIAMDNARLLNEIRQRQSELNITFENMGDGVAMFDCEQKLAAWNRNFQDILDLPDDAVRVGLPFADYIRDLAAKGEYGPDADADEQIARLTALLGRANRFERTRPNGHVIDIRQNPIPGGGFVIIYADITERKRAEEALRVARDAAEQALRDLRLAQANLVQAEKMASLGQLTAGIAHEIKNPLNFVNNFASLSVDLLAELKEAAEPGFAALTEDQRAEIDDVSDMLTSNLQKISEHGRRADGIVKAMLEHSRGASGERREVDINALADEALNLAYHGARAQDQDFNITLERDFGEGITPIELNPQDVTRVLLNLFGNGFYAATSRGRNGAAPGFSPTLKLATRDLGSAVEIRVRDNGTGIPEDIRDKLFQPFFTTKPTGEGTGLGLSITYDIVTKAHGGTVSVDSEVDEFTEFVVTLPRRMFGSGGSLG